MYEINNVKECDSLHVLNGNPVTVNTFPPPN